MPTPPAAPCLSIVVVSYNTRDLLRSCLESIRAEEIAEVVVVDNASTDGSPGMVAAEFPAARLIANRHNPGYGGGANQGIAACGAPFVLLLNGDTVLHPGAAARLADWLGRHPRCAVAGPRLLNPDGTLQSSCFPWLTPFNVLALNTWLNRLVRRLPRFRSGIDPTTGFAGTLHLNQGYARLEQAYADAAAGRVPDPLPCESYCHSLTDPSIVAPDLQQQGFHTLTIFGLPDFPVGQPLVAVVSASPDPASASITPPVAVADGSGNSGIQLLGTPTARLPQVAGTWSSTLRPFSYGPLRLQAFRRGDAG